MKIIPALFLTSTLALAGCATQVRSTGDHAAALTQSGALARPQRILLAGFQLRPDQVELDRGVASRIGRWMGTADPVSQQAALAGEVERSTVEALSDALARQGYMVERVAPGQLLAAGDLIVEGRFVSVDQGNRTRRLAIGFGAGRSDVSATVAVLYVGADRVPRALHTYDATSTSGRKPGLAVGGLGAVAQASAVPIALSGALSASGEVNRAGIAGQGRRLAEELADKLGDLFAAQGWNNARAAPATAQP